MTLKNALDQSLQQEPPSRGKSSARWPTLRLELMRNKGRVSAPCRPGLVLRWSCECRAAVAPALSLTHTHSLETLIEFHSTYLFSNIMASWVPAPLPHTHLKSEKWARPGAETHCGHHNAPVHMACSGCAVGVQGLPGWVGWWGR